MLQVLAKKHGFEFTPIPVTHPGVEQKSQRLAIRQNRPDYVLVWGWGVMNGTAVKEAAAVAYPREKMIGVVVRRRAGCDAGRRSGSRLQVADAPAWCRESVHADLEVRLCKGARGRRNLARSARFS